MTQEKKQTAVEWFFDNLKNHEIQAEHYNLYQQALAMEREQIKDAYNNGENRSAELYYNETYGKE